MEESKNRCMSGSAIFTAFASKLHMKVPNATVRTVAIPDFFLVISIGRSYNKNNYSYSYMSHMGMSIRT